jgi:hypothetical protein
MVLSLENEKISSHLSCFFFTLQSSFFALVKNFGTHFSDFFALNKNYGILRGEKEL